jgi:WD40 repeat protein
VAVGIPGATPFGGHAGPVHCVAFSPDGTAFATGGEDGVVRLWDTASRAQTRQLAGHAGPVVAVAWSPDGASIAAGGDTIVRLWDAASGEQAGQLTGHSHVVRAVAWSPDGGTVASGARTVRLWDARTGQQVQQFSGHHHGVNAVAWSPDGNAIASGALSVRVWEPGTGRQVRQLSGDGHLVRSVAWNPDGSVLAAGSGTICLWAAVSGTLIRRFTDIDEEYWHVITWNHDGSIIATNGGDANVELWDAATGQPAGELTGHTAQVRAIAWTADGTTIATSGGDDCTVRLWDAATRQQTARLAGHTGTASHIVWSPDGSAIATVGVSDQTVRLWNAATGEQTGQVVGHDGGARAIAWHPDGATIVVADTGGAVCRWNALTADQPHLVTRYDDPVNAVAWNPAGTILAIAPSDGTIRLWDLAAGQQAGQLAGDGYSRAGSPDVVLVLAIAWSPGGDTIAGVHSTRSTWLWNAASSEQIWQLAGSNASAYALAWSPDGNTIATPGPGGSLRLCDAITGRQAPQLTGPSEKVFRLAWSPDGNTIASTGDGDAISLWDPAAGQQVRQLTGHIGRAHEVAWSPDGNTIASTGSDGTIRLWNPRSGAQIIGTGFGKTRVPARPLAGVRSDSPSETDLLGVAEDVAMLAELIAATETRPPLAIALIGDWGTGKSSVMLQIERHVTGLADRARNNPGLTAWAETVRQVRFNAWHYSDERLWAGLVSHLFDVLAAPASEAEDESAPDPRSVAAERGKLKAVREGKRQASRQLEGKLKAADALSRPAGSLAWLMSPGYAARVLVTVAWQGFRDLRASLLTLLGWIALGAGAYAAWHYAQGWIAAVSTAAAVVLPPATAALGRTRAFVSEQRASLAARQQAYQRDIKSLDDQLVLIDAAERLARFLTEHGEGSAYRKYQGLLGQVRFDLDQLAADLRDARRQWERGGRAGPPPLERIVLYIDDLDRCPPRRVVEVLEAVHLMLALDLFVVVVAVDARWLIRSLEYHHHELFKGDEQDESLATPIDYLDKIFQIPFTLLPPAPGATADFLRSLLPQPAPTRPAPARPGAATGAEVVEVVEASGEVVEASAAPDAAGAAEAAASPGGSEFAAGAELAGGDQGAASIVGPAADQPTGEARVPPDVMGGGLPGLLPGAAPEPPAAAGPVPGIAEAAAVELRPLGLQVSQAEVEFMARLGELLPTPRVAKRLVNLYRLVRIGVRSGELAEFVGDENGAPYQAVQVLLAILVGHPEFAREMFRVILDTAGERFRKHDYADLAAVAAEAGARGGAPHSFGIVHGFLDKMRHEAPAAVSMAECRRWCPRLARFSFYTRELAGRDLGGDASRG